MLSEQPSSSPKALPPPSLQLELTHDHEPNAAPLRPSAAAWIPAREALPTVSVGIRVKLIALMVGVSFLIVSVLTSYLTARQIAGLREDLRARAAAYGRLASLQLRSAIAFKDEETAREVLSAIAKDPQVLGVGLYREGGIRLHTEGTLSELARASRRGFEEARTFSLPGRILVAIPVQSLEGPRGTLVMELTTAPANAARAQLIRAALLIGGSALLLGILLASGIARSLARRVEDIAQAAAAVAAGDLERPLAFGGARDEIGVLAHAFSAMVRHLRELLAHIHRTAREEKVRLEQLVSERTSQLDRKNADYQLVLDNVEQGFVTIDRSALVVGEQSRIVAQWLGQIERGDSLWMALDRASPGCFANFDVAWSQLIDGFMPGEVCLAQMPRERTIGGRHLRFEYKPLGDAETFDKLLVVISDATAEVERDRNQQQERDLLNLSGRLLHDRSGFLDFASETELLLQRLASNRSDLLLLGRDLHTLKGNSGLYGLSLLSGLCHTQESNLESGLPVDCSAIVREWQSIRHTTHKLVGERSVTGLEIDRAEHQAVLNDMRAGRSRAELARRIEAWALEPIAVRLERAAEQLSALAERTGKGTPTIAIEAGRVYLAREELSEFWNVFAHIVRNGVAHGLARPEQRSARLRESSDFTLRAGMQAGSLFVEFADRGPGIDWDVIRQRAQQRGLPAKTEAELMQALFADGVSAESEASEFAGRGVGLSAVREACQSQRGQVEVTSARGTGTKFRFSWPAAQFKSLIQLDGVVAT
ncbi:MAG TPA: HAMP domain-containing protein [Polyangiaceae bacterium]|nr:HAMP domain-containing protein [Polyangiaceae bacterium]